MKSSASKSRRRVVVVNLNVPDSAFIPACHGHPREGRLHYGGGDHRRAPGLRARAARANPSDRFRTFCRNHDIPWHSGATLLDIQSTSSCRAREAPQALAQSALLAWLAERRRPSSCAEACCPTCSNLCHSERRLYWRTRVATGTAPPGLFFSC